MAKQNEYCAQEQSTKSLEGASTEITTEKKPFVEPELSPAVDVLEATTFLQFTESGATNPP